MSDWTQRLVELDACASAVEWAREYASAEAAWVACPRGDWMLWWLVRGAGPWGSTSHRTVAGHVAACARLALPIWERWQPGDARPRAALDLVDAYAVGEQVSREALRAAGRAVRACSAAAASAAASAAAYAAASSDAAAAYAAYAASADAATAAAADAADATHDRHRARADMLRRCAELIRERGAVAPGDGSASR